MTDNSFPRSTVGTPPITSSDTTEIVTPVTETSNEMMTPEQAATYLQVEKTTLGVWRSTKKGPPFSKTGNRRGAVILYNKTDLDSFKNSAKIRIRKNKKTNEPIQQ